MNATVKFTIERETKGTYVFAEVDEQGEPRPRYGDPNKVVGTLYVSKRAFDKLPTALTVTLETE